MKKVKINHAHIKLIHSSDIDKDYSGAINLPHLTKSNMIQGLTLNALTLKGCNGNDPFYVFNQDYSTSWLKEFKLIKPPFFLRKYLRNEEHIFICQMVKLEDYQLKTNDQVLQEMLTLKAWINQFEALYLYSAEKCVKGVLFKLPDQQFELFTPFEELFSYIAPHIDMNGEVSCWYLPTDQANYDYFVELSGALNQKIN